MELIIKRRLAVARKRDCIAEIRVKAACNAEWFREKRYFKENIL